MPEPKPTHILSLLVSSAALLIFNGCGGSESLVHIEHIQGTSGSISKTTLNHWMRAMAGGDYRAGLARPGPAGLVSEPANYGECAASAKTIVPRTSTGQLTLSNAEIDKKCHQLYRSIKAQALSFLITVQWTIGEGAEHGIKVSDEEVHRAFTQYRKQPYPTEAVLKKYMSDRQWVLSDILYQLKRNILTTKLQPKLEAKVKSAGGGERVLAKLYLEREKALIARTSCRAGYVAPGCKEYHGPSVVPPAPNIILERFIKGISG